MRMEVEIEHDHENNLLSSINFKIIIKEGKNPTFLKSNFQVFLLRLRKCLSLRLW